MALNVCAAIAGFSVALTLDLRNGNLVTHLVFGFACIAIPTFIYFVSRYGMFSEDAEYIVMEIEASARAWRAKVATVRSRRSRCQGERVAAAHSIAVRVRTWASPRRLAQRA